MRVDCSYLVTTWSVDGEEIPLREQRLLSQVLQVMSAYPTIPPKFLLGTQFEALTTELHGQESPLAMVTAQGDKLPSPADFWTALGNQLRPSVAVTVTIALPTLRDQEPETTPTVITRNLQLAQRIAPATGELIPSFFRISGQVTDVEGQPVVGARVTLVEWNLSAQTDTNGYYTMGVISGGAYTLRVEQGNQVQEASITVPVEAEARDYNIQLQQ